MSGVWEITDISPASSLRSDMVAEEQNDSMNLDCQEIKNVHRDRERDDAKVKWLSGPWPIKQYEGNLHMNERKAEWFRFRDQFDRIISCKPEVDPMTKLTGLKVHAGSYLLSVIEMQEKSIKEPCFDIFTQVKEALNNYFNKMCDTPKERMKFREMSMGSSEAFDDWILRLENQAKFCDFTMEQREEEFLQAIARRSVPEIATKLYEVSEIFDRNVERLITHGQHLDYMRRELDEKENKKNTGDIASDGTYETKHVNFVHRYERNYDRNRGATFRGRGGQTRVFQHNWRGRGRQNNRMSQDYLSRPRKDCNRCGRIHGPRNCKAFGLKCHKCRKVGHFANFCRNHDETPEEQEVKDSKQGVKNEVNQIHQVLFSDSE